MNSWVTLKTDILAKGFLDKLGERGLLQNKTESRLRHFLKVDRFYMCIDLLAITRAQTCLDINHSVYRYD